jgi:anti-sigma-K factor RskA
MTSLLKPPSGAPEDDLLAAELALGGLDLEGRARLQARMAHDPAFAALVARWDEMLSPMASDVEEIAPGPDVRRRLMRGLFGAETRGATARRVRYDPGQAASAAAASGASRKLAAWQALALGGAMAAGLMFIAPGLAPTPAPVAVQPQYVAIIQSQDGDLSFVALLDPAAGALLARRVAGVGAGGETYQLWMLDGAAPPVSLGLLEEGASLRHVFGTLPQAAVLAVSREPAGGSPTGAPTGPVVAMGAPVEL